MSKAISLIEDQWCFIAQFLPENLDAHAHEHGAMRRKSGHITSADQLLRVLMMHIAGGLSLEQTCARAKQRGLADINAMALHKRLCTSSRWLTELTKYVVKSMTPFFGNEKSLSIKGKNLRALDASTISEPGSTGTDWRIHYSIRLPELCCDFFELTDVKGGESVKRLNINENDVILLDRDYNDRQAISQLIEKSASVLLRFHSRAFPLLTKTGEALNLLPLLRKLKIGNIKEFDAYFQDKNTKKKYAVRICVLRKSEEAAKKAERKIIAKARDIADKIKSETLEYSKYIIVLTNVSIEELTTKEVLEYYRARWQIELAFKRLKTLLELGQLPKKKEASSISWMQGKILCALLIERILCEARFFSPWGYPLR